MDSMQNMKKRIIAGEGFRITVLTERLLRLEYQAEGRFTDARTQVVSCRDFGDREVAFERREIPGGKGAELETEALLVKYAGGPFSGMTLSILVKATGETWTPERRAGTLWGTARTLDETDGNVLIEPGLFSREGFGVLDDSKSLLFDPKAEAGGQVYPRKEEGSDLYFFGYGHDYYAGLKDFYRLTGRTPMIPRYALGNWWSRFYKYTEETYMELVEGFEREGIPLAVAVIDMDWHLTQVDPRYGTGWTGYTWNREYFPDPARFLKHLHDHHLKATLNVHPADGIRAFEDPYEEMALAMGIDPATEAPVEMDLTDPQFRKAYFDIVNHPMEDMGVDFWWIDWQQGTKSKMEHLDPLWLLNHYYFKDQEGRNVRPMIFSRYAGPGSHRYPVGFSGDTYATWKSLQLQPYFTLTASNIGYGWWSHDICGHMHGQKSDEMMIRWLQFGVFSPIMRLHSSGNIFFRKEPWNQSPENRRIMADFLRLRHRLIPYLYTMNRRSYEEGEPLIRPMYYECPECEDAYEVKSQYFFGTELLVGSIVRPMDEELRMGSVSCLLPEGTWHDLRTGYRYRGGRRMNLYREITDIPVLLKDGGVLPLAGEECLNAEENPKVLDWYVGAGSSGSFTLYEDDGSTMEYRSGAFLETTLSYVRNADGSARVTILIEGRISLMKPGRIHRVHLLGTDAEVFELAEQPEEIFLRKDFAPGEIREKAHDVGEALFHRIDLAWIPYDMKEQLYGYWEREQDPAAFWERARKADISPALKEALYEVLNLC